MLSVEGECGHSARIAMSVGLWEPVGVFVCAPGASRGILLLICLGCVPVRAHTLCAAAYSHICLICMCGTCVPVYPGRRMVTTNL